VQRQLEAARHPATPWLRRLALIELLRQQWGTPPEWELLELELRYSGPEWSIPLLHETLCQLERLKGRAHLEAIVAIRRTGWRSIPSCRGPSAVTRNGCIHSWSGWPCASGSRPRGTVLGCLR
jgi:hypothetical protein